jgi:predicted O-methyltransferase YrrM
MAEMTLGQYVDDLFGGEDELLRTMRVEAEQQGLPLIQVPLDLGRLLRLLIAQASVTSILEIGTLFGYSAVLMARALPPEAKLLTLEVNPVHAELARKNVARAGVNSKVEIREGPALETLAALRGETFDLIFIDANKDQYPDYLREALGLTHPGSLIVADNVWRRGEVVDPAASDAGNQGIARFNREIATHPRLLSTIIPTRDCSDATSVSLVRG